MATNTTISGFDTTSLLNYYSAQLGTAAARSSQQAAAKASTSTSSSSKSSATSKDVTPWSQKAAAQTARDKEILTSKSFLDLSKVPLLAGSTADSKTEQDNQKLFALYTAINNLSYLATMSKREGTTAGQMEGYNTRFQAGLAEIQKFVGTEDFNNFSLQAKEPSASVTSTAAVAKPAFNYTGSVLVDGNNVNNPLAGLSKTDSFTISVKKGGVTQDVAIDLSKIEGDLTLGNLVSYVNQTLAAGGYQTRFKKALVAGSIDATTTANKAKQQYALQIEPGGTEQVSLSASSAPSLYFSSTIGSTTSTTTKTAGSTTLTTTAANNQGRLVKLSDLDNPQAEFSRSITATDGTTTASSTVVDKDGNVYVLGNSTGDMGTQLNQGSQDVYLTKYDSAGQVVWNRLVGSAGTADGAAMALNPNGGVTIVGSSTAKLTTASLANGVQDSFAIKYDSEGNQVWTTQIPTLNKNAATSVSVDDSGNVYIGGQTTGVIGAGQTKVGGQDGYLAKIDAKGKIVSEQQFGTTGSDTVSATTLTEDGDLLVASMQNGHAILSKYAGGAISSAPTWQMDLGDLQTGGSIGGIAVKDGKVYVSGTTANGDLNATVAKASSGGSEAFVFAATDNGDTVTADHVSYVGTAAGEKGAGITVGDDGTVYLVGTTNGTFDGQVRNAQNTNNAFVTSLDASGSVNWTKQYGGLDGQSIGTSIAFANTGASVLDSLGLPSGKISGQQNTYLAASTTLRQGDFFKVQIMGDAGRTFKITIDKNETLSTLVTKINAQFGNKGKASISYTANGASLKLDVAAGVTAKLIAGTNDTVVGGNSKTGTAATTVKGSSEFDALARLGIDEQTLSKPADSKSKTTTKTTTDTSYALGLASKLDISTTTGAGAARSQLLSVLNAIQKIYQTTNTPAAADTATSSAASAKMSAAAATYQNNLNNAATLALSLLQT